jgi:hypothetical protein
MPVTASMADAIIPLLFDFVPRFVELDPAPDDELLLEDVEAFFVTPDVFDLDADVLPEGDDFAFTALFPEPDDLLPELFLDEVLAAPPALLFDDVDFAFEPELVDFDLPDVEADDRDVDDFFVEAFFVVGMLVPPVSIFLLRSYASSSAINMPLQIRDFM